MLWFADLPIANYFTEMGWVPPKDAISILLKFGKWYPDSEQRIKFLLNHDCSVPENVRLTSQIKSTQADPLISKPVN